MVCIPVILHDPNPAREVACRYFLATSGLLDRITLRETMATLVIDNIKSLLHHF